MRKGTCCAISWVWWWFLPHQPWLIPFPSLSGSVLPADGSLKAAIPYPSLSRRHLGFLHRMGTAEGAVGQASPSLSHPVCSRPSPDPPADLTSPSVRIPPAALSPPSLRGPCMPWDQGREGKRGLCGRDTSPSPCRALMHLREQVRRCLLLHNWSDGIRGVGLYINAPALISSFWDFQASSCALAMYFFLKEKRK